MLIVSFTTVDSSPLEIIMKKRNPEMPMWKTVCSAPQSSREKSRRQSCLMILWCYTSSNWQDSKFLTSSTLLEEPKANTQATALKGCSIRMTLSSSRYLSALSSFAATTIHQISWTTSTLMWWEKAPTRERTRRICSALSALREESKLSTSPLSLAISRSWRFLTTSLKPTSTIGPRRA